MNMLIKIKSNIVNINRLLLILVVIGIMLTLSNPRYQTFNVFIWLLVIATLAIRKRSTHKELSNRSAVICFLIAVLMLFTAWNTDFHTNLDYANSIIITCVVMISLIITLELYDFQNIVFGTLFGPLILIGIPSLMLGLMLVEASLAILLVLYLSFIYGILTFSEEKSQSTRDD